MAIIELADDDFEDVDTCDCPECQLQRAVFDAAGLDPEGALEPISCGLTLMAMARTLGILMGALHYDDCEHFWRLCLEMRARAIDPDCAGDVPEGRA
jgi:hypothetical protein